MPENESAITVIVYRDVHGREPFTEWLNALRHPPFRRRILRRLLRLETGNFGDYKSVGSGVYELRFFFGSGYRVYFGQTGNTLVILLCGGDKSSQRTDIRKAQEYWQEYLSHD
jgi:putative addiction module killer protein